MTRSEMAKGLLQQALSSLESAKKASEDGHYAFAVHSSQDVSELSLKALLLFTGSEPPKVHDLTHTLRSQRDDLAELGLSGQKMETMAASAGDLAQNRTRSLYGDERHDIPATELFEARDAAQAIRAAELIHERCRETVERNIARP